MNVREQTKLYDRTKDEITLSEVEPIRLCQIAKGLATTLEHPQETDSYRLWVLGNALAALAAKMEPQAAAEIAKVLAAASENPQETDLHRLSSLGRSLGALAAKMEPEVFPTISSRASGQS
jgi:hypothetical protein